MSSPLHAPLATTDEQVQAMRLQDRQVNVTPIMPPNPQCARPNVHDHIVFPLLLKLCLEQMFPSLPRFTLSSCLHSNKCKQCISCVCYFYTNNFLPIRRMPEQSSWFFVLHSLLASSNGMAFSLLFLSN